MNFWKQLPKPILALAPMANVTDAAFRRLIAKYGGPDVMWTEFVSADGLFMGGREALLPDLAYAETERPIVAQFFTSQPAIMKKAAALAVELGFDGIDINMGCPDKTIEKQGAGAALLKNPRLAQALIYAAREGAGKLPLSVKTRLGFNKIEINTWIPALLETKLDALSIHLRTRKEMSKTPAHWELAGEIVRMRDQMKSQTLILANGDVASLAEAREKAQAYGLDGIMLGRAIFGNPWLFNKNKKEASPEEKLQALLEHTKLFAELLPHKSFSIMKKHFKAYVNGWEGAKELRIKLMETGNGEEVAAVIASELN